MNAQPWPEADASVLAPVAEHEDLRKVMRDILQTHASHEQVRSSVETPQGYSADLWTLLNEEMSVSSLAVPEDRGGLGFGVSELAVVLEEGGRALLPEPLLLSGVLGARAVLAAPAGNVPADLVSGVLAGTLVTSVTLGATTLTVEDGTVSGRVDRVLYGATADLLVVPAETCLYLVDLRHAAVRTPLEVLDLTRRQARLELDSAPAYLIAGPGDLEAVRGELGALSAIGLAAEHVGMIDVMLELTRKYAGQRHQFGRPLSSFQVIKHRLADLLIDLERARSAARYAAAVFDQDPAAAALPAAVAGAICTDAVIKAAAETVQLHGGVGFTWEHAAHFYVRRALGDEAVFGPSRTHRARIAELLGI
ncbi:MAG TPA: acyl-CoA dehydrogenase family protein [Nocardioidaceae bacterium]|nr:acyl-CoA dehydrogenase family protein [Nocardioidaceae bacterium]